MSPLPKWLRWTLILAIVAALAGIGAKIYRHYTASHQLKVAIADEGQAKAIFEALSKRLKTTRARVQLEPVVTKNMAESAKLFADDKVDLALLRADYPGQANARAVVVALQSVALLLLPPGSPAEDFDDLKGKTIGVVNGEANKRVVDALASAYSFDRGKFRDLSREDARKQILGKQIQALLVVTPITDGYLKTARELLGLKQKQKPGIVAIEQAEAIANTARYYESYELPKGTLWGSPLIPDEEMTTLRVPTNLVVQRRVKDDVVTELTKTIMESRGTLVADYPILNMIRAPETEKDAFIPVHPGAAVFYGGEEKSFFDKYGDWFFYGPMLAGALASMFAGLWKFLAVGAVPGKSTSLALLAGLIARARKAENENDLSAIEDEVDKIVRAELIGNDAGIESAADPGAMTLAVVRCQQAVARRRGELRAGKAAPPATHSVAPANG